MKRSSNIILLMIVLIALGFFLLRGRISTYFETRPDSNVILVVCDTLRPDHLGCYGYDRDTSRNIDSFADDAVLFKNAYAQAPATIPSMLNIVTSRYLTENPVEDDIVTMAEYFRLLGYKTGAFIAQTHLLQILSNLSQGFDVYDVNDGSDDIVEQDVEEGAVKTGVELSRRRATSVTDAAIQWIEQNRNESFFVWAVYFDPHDPYIPSDRFKGYYNKTSEFSGDRRAGGIGIGGEKNHLVTPEHKRFLINAYDEEVRYFDHEFGRLVSYLKEADLYENTMVLFTSDHGEELGDNGNRWDHCQILSQEEIRIPLIVKMPGMSGKKTVDGVVQNIDIYPTIVEYFGGDTDPDIDDLHGFSMLGLIEGARGDDQKRFAASFWRDQRCLIIENFKYWVSYDREYLIDMNSGFQVMSAEQSKKFKDELNEIIKRYGIDNKSYQKVMQRLKELGYL